MRYILLAAGALLIFLGSVWFLQGINVLPGSFMTGQTEWAVYGAITVIVGLFLFVRGRRQIRGAGLRR